MSYGNYQAPPPPSDPPRRNRDGCMTLFLLGLGILQTISAVFFLLGVTQINFGWVDIFSGIIIFGGLIAIMGLWSWQKWGYYTLMAVFGIDLMVAVGLAAGTIEWILLRLLMMSVLYLLYRDKMALLK